MITNDFLTKITPATVIGKQRAYVVIPAFPDAGSISTPWLGASRLIRIYNYTATNNFTISSVDFGRMLTTLWIRGFEVCIRYKSGQIINSVSYETITRYKLIDNPDGILYVPMYNGEIIKKNFSIEIWSINSPGEVTNNVTPIYINMSILRAKPSLESDTTYENVEGEVCTDIYAANPLSDPDIPAPFVFASCASGGQND